MYKKKDKDSAFMPVEVWRRDAACHQAPEADRRVFLPWGVDKNRVRPKDTYRVRKQYCDNCPVQEKCLNFAAETESLGIWGGFNFTWARFGKIHELKKQHGWITLEMVRNLFGITD